MDDDLGEDCCFSCKDGGELRVCDFRNCRKAYHHHCVQKDESFLEDDNTWECPWHSCYNCNKMAVFQCYGCPNSSACHTCVKEVEFVPARNSNKGFCRICLRLAILIEENKDYTSDGEKVDFDDPRNIEKHLFRDYWYIIKDSESISLSDLKAAKRKLKRTGSEEENMSDENYELEPEPELDSSTSYLPEEESRKRKSKAKLKVNSSLSNKKCRSKMRKFIKWGSEELIGFLVSVGKDADVSLSQGDVERVVKRYIENNNLYEPGKKKKFVLCDDKLRALFGKRRVKFSKIYKLLEEHFPGNQADIILFSESDEEQEEESVAVKKRKLNVGQASHMQDVVSVWERFVNEKKMCTAALVRENIKLVYLRQALVLQFLKNPDTFEHKIVGCFVRVKHHAKEFYEVPPNLYQIGQVTGVKRDAETYQVGGMNTDIAIRVSNIHKDVKLSSLADEDFSDKDIEDLRNLVQKGLYKMPTVGEVAEKLKYLHEEITCHWIGRELVRLTKLKQLASEKGWRKEIELLRKPEEQERLKKEIPLILPDSEDENEVKEEEEEEKGEKYQTEQTKVDNKKLSNSEINGHVMNHYLSVGFILVLNLVLLDAKAEASHQKPGLADAKAEASHQKPGLADVKAETSHQTPATSGDGKAEASHQMTALAGGANGRNTDNFTITSETNGNTASEVPKEELESKELTEITMAVTNGNALREERAEFKSQDSLKSDSKGNHAREPNNCFETPTQQPVHSNKDAKPNNTKQPVIDISDSDSEDSGFIKLPGQDDEVWFYMDPLGKVQGPFSMKLLRGWGQRGFFDEHFKVWRDGQSRQDAVLLNDISRHYT